MERLARGEKREWKSSLDPYLIRTGCRDLEEAIMWGFRDYRETDTATQKKMIQTKFISESNPSIKKWIQFQNILSEEYEKKKKDRDIAEDDRMLFFFLISPRLIAIEIIPYIEKFLHNDWDIIEKEIIDKCCSLAETRLLKKIKDEENLPIHEVRDIITSYIQKQMKRVQTDNVLSYDDLQKACINLGNHVIIVTANDRILFDSFTWKDGIIGSDFWDTLVILAHPDNHYDSIGRLSYTKDKHQKISRLFHYDDILIESIRKKMV